MATKARTEKMLAEFGFAFDWSVTGKDPVWPQWLGTIDPVGRFSIDGECRGITVAGDTASAMYDEAIEAARQAREMLEPCSDPDCDMHGHDA